MFASTLPQALEFADLLAGEATVRGLIGPREVPRLWERHLLNCGVVADLIAEESTVCDVGSGAGLPGLVLAIRRPDISMTLLEPLLRRTAFLDLAVDRMGLSNVVVHRGRAEDMAKQTTSRPGPFQNGFDVVTSRAVAPMERLAGWCLPLTRVGGQMLAMKGSTASEELAASVDAVSRAGGASPEIHKVGAPWLDPPVTVVSVRRQADSDSKVTSVRKGHGWDR